MRSMQEHNIPAAQQMRESGMSWRAIGRAFNVKEETVMAALDPMYRERMRQRTRDSRARNGRAPIKRLDTRVIVPKPVKPDGVWKLKSLEGMELGIRAITRIATRNNGRGECSVRISLPYIPTLYRQHSDRET